MRNLSATSIAIVLAVALYFTLLWGFDALHMLASPTYGLDDAWRSQFVFELGSLFSLSPIGLIKLAAFFATLKLVAAGVCALHIADRFSVFAGRKADPEMLEAGLLLAALITIASAGLAIWHHNFDLVREQAVLLAVAVVGIALCMLERTDTRNASATTPVEHATAI